MSSAMLQNVVHDNIEKYPVLMYGLSKCPHCIKAKELLASKNIQVEVIELDKLDSSQ